MAQDDKQRHALSLFQDGEYEQAIEAMAQSESVGDTEYKIFLGQCKSQLAEQYKYLISEALSNNDTLRAHSYKQEYLEKFGSDAQIEAIEIPETSESDTPDSSYGTLSDCDSSAIYEPTKICPHCGKEILAVAQKCIYCKNWLPQESAQGASSATAGDEIPTISQHGSAAMEQEGKEEEMTSNHHPSENPEDYQYYEEQEPSHNYLWWIVGAVAVLACIFICIGKGGSSGAEADDVDTTYEGPLVMVADEPKEGVEEVEVIDEERPAAELTEVSFDVDLFQTLIAKTTSEVLDYLTQHGCNVRETGGGAYTCELEGGNITVFPRNASFPRLGEGSVEFLTDDRSIAEKWAKELNASGYQDLGADIYNSNKRYWSKSGPRGMEIIIYDLMDSEGEDYAGSITMYRAPNN